MPIVAHMDTTKQLESKKLERLALSVNEVAELLGVSIRHVWALHASAQIPRPLKLGRSCRWVRTDLLAWMEGGAPSREEWESQKAKAGR